MRARVRVSVCVRVCARAPEQVTTDNVIDKYINLRQVCVACITRKRDLLQTEKRPIADGKETYYLLQAVNLCQARVTRIQMCTDV